MKDKIIKNMRPHDPTCDELYFQAHITKDYVIDVYNIDVKIGSRRKIGIHMDASLSLLLNDVCNADKKTYSDDNLTMTIISSKAGNCVLFEFDFEQNMKSKKRFDDDNVSEFTAYSGIIIELLKNSDNTYKIPIYSSSTSKTCYRAGSGRIKSVNTDIVNDSILFEIDDVDQLKYTENDCLGNEDRGIRICGTLTPVIMDVEDRAEDIGYYEIYAIIPYFATSAGIDHTLKTSGDPIVKTEALLYDNRYCETKVNEDIASTLYSLAVDRI